MGKALAGKLLSVSADNADLERLFPSFLGRGIKHKAASYIENLILNTLTLN